MLDITLNTILLIVVVWAAVAMIAVVRLLAAPYFSGKLAAMLAEARSDGLWGCPERHLLSTSRRRWEDCKSCQAKITTVLNSRRGKALEFLGMGVPPEAIW